MDKITDYSGKNVIVDNSQDPEVVTTAGVTTSNMQVVKEGMRQVVTSGTAKDVFGNYSIAVAAKTGTAENIGTDNVTFIAFAPYEKPEIAVAVVIEHGGSGKYSMNTAKAMFDAYFKSTGKISDNSSKTTSSKTSSNTSSKTTSSSGQRSQ